jgi:hypothetical protein
MPGGWGQVPGAPRVSPLWTGAPHSVGFLLGRSTQNRGHQRTSDLKEAGEAVHLLVTWPQGTQNTLCTASVGRGVTEIRLTGRRKEAPLDAKCVKELAAF